MLDDDYTAIRAECRAANAVARRLQGGERYVQLIRTEKQAKVVPQKRKWAPTAPQLEVLAFMRDFLAENDEIPPYWAIAQHFGWSSAASAQGHVLALAQKGLLERNKIGNWRIARREETTP